MYNINTDIINNNMKKIINNIDIINDYIRIYYIDMYIHIRTHQRLIVIFT